MSAIGKRQSNQSQILEYPRKPRLAIHEGGIEIVNQRDIYLIKQKLRELLGSSDALQGHSGAPEPEHKATHLVPSWRSAIDAVGPSTPCADG